MTIRRDLTLRDIVQSAAGKRPKERSEYLNEVCGRDQALREEVERLVRNAHNREDPLATALLGTHAPTLDPDATGDAGIPAALCFDSYRILGLLGEGSMGVVYRAEQKNPHRVVALKVLKAGAGSAGALKRFQQEAQTLGRLQHPGIAQIFEAGTARTEYGPQPFFAMELIRGLPLTEYARKHALDSRGRLELLVKVCDGVEHAHQKGVIHRDLKPSNILVDESGQPKILDFGIALATETASGAGVSASAPLAGTIPYMSLEQVQGKPGELDTRTDVYALGVIAYELLAGCLPYDLRQKSLPEAVQVISQAMPRGLGSIQKAYRGDLEIIINKALEREKSLRYQAASSLADDFRRYLSDEPILARPASSVYVFAKFAKRNKALVGGAVATWLALVVGLIASTTLYVKAEKDRRYAEERTERAMTAVQRANASADVFFDIFFRNANPENTEKRLTVQEALDDVAAKINDGTRQLEPKVEAAVHLTLGKSYRVAGLLDKAEAHLVSALRIDRRDLGVEDPQTLADLDELALLYQALGKFTEAEAQYRTALETRRRVLGPEDRKTLETQHNLAQLLDAMGQSSTAERMYRETLKIQHRVLPEEDPLTLRTTNALAFLLKKKSELSDAERLYRRTLSIQERTLGEDHPDTLQTANNLAALLKIEGRWSEAEALYRQTLNTRRRILGNDHPNTLTSMNNLAIVLKALEKWDEASRLYRETMASLNSKLGAGHPKTLKATMNFAIFLQGRGQLTEAEKLYRKTRQSLRTKLGGRHRSTINATYSLGVLLVEKKEYAEAEPLLREALESWREVLPEDHPDIAVGLFKLGEVLLMRKKLTEAEPLLRQCVSMRRDQGKPGDWKTANAENALGDCLLQLGKLREAEPLLRESYPILDARFGDRDRHTLEAIRRLAHLYRVLGEPDKAAEYRRLLQKRTNDPTSTKSAPQ